MTEAPKVSIIIACKTVDSDTTKCIHECARLDYPDFEILVLPDADESLRSQQVEVIPTGAVRPSTKRNIGMKKSQGEIFAFIDSDAYPQPNWLKNAVHYFSASDVGAVTGPNVTPPEDSFLQQAGGDVLNSYIAMGGFSRRYQVTDNDFETADIMSCNFILPRTVAEQLNGFDDSILTGEDYKFGLEILAKQKKIIYSSAVCVYHHRRALFLPHLRQMWNYGRDKGMLMRQVFSLSKTVYFLPTLLVGWILGGLAVSYMDVQGFRTFYFLSLSGYLVLLLVASLRIENRKRSLYVFCGILLTHMAYGISFLIGLLAQNHSKYATHSGRIA